MATSDDVAMAVAMDFICFNACPGSDYAVAVAKAGIR